jgi:hypothetical protein
MGLFNFFKKPTPKMEQKIISKPKMPDQYLGDLKKTEIIFNLVKVPKQDRNEKWKNEFLSNIPTASFRCGDPQVIKGPDGFPYFQLLLPKPGVSFQCFTIEKMVDAFLLEKGFGVVIEPSSGQPDWVLSYGDILNYSLRKEFFTKDSLFSTKRDDEEIKENEPMMMGQPSEKVLPECLRKLLRIYFQKNEIISAKILLMARHVGESVSQDLVFNLTPDKFESESRYNQVMQGVRWYLPRHYSYISLSENQFGNDFKPL